MGLVLPLNEIQLKSLPQQTDMKAKPVRFMCERKSVNLCTGDLVGGNIINQYVYWDRPKIFVDMVLTFLRMNNPLKEFKAVFSK